MGVHGGLAYCNYPLSLLGFSINGCLRERAARTDAQKDTMMNAETSLEGMYEEREEERPRATNKQDQCVKQPSVNTSAVKRREIQSEFLLLGAPPPPEEFLD